MLVIGGALHEVGESLALRDGSRSRGKCLQGFGRPPAGNCDKSLLIPAGYADLRSEAAFSLRSLGGEPLHAGNQVIAPAGGGPVARHVKDRSVLSHRLSVGEALRVWLQRRSIDLQRSWRAR